MAKDSTIVPAQTQSLRRMQWLQRVSLGVDADASLVSMESAPNLKPFSLSAPNTCRALHPKKA